MTPPYMGASTMVQIDRTMWASSPTGVCVSIVQIAAVASLLRNDAIGVRGVIGSFVIGSFVIGSLMIGYSIMD